MAKERNFRRLKPAAFAALLLALAGCSDVTNEPFSGAGGGGGGAGPAPIFNCTGASEFDWSATAGGTTYCSYGLGTIGADAAYAKGATGAGALVAVIDTGIDPTHTELDANISPNSIDIVRGIPIADEDGHGTHVAGIIAAEKNGVGNHGVAFNATILAIRADTRVIDSLICGSLNPCSVFYDADITAALDYAALQSADVINMSLGGSAPLDPATKQALIGAMAAGAIIVAATGNDGAAQPGYPAAYAGDATVNASGQMIAVGAVDETGALAFFSNRCGAAMNFCLVAPGVDILSTYPGGWAVGSGTSQATPFVSGAAALLVATWPTLTPAQVVDILLVSATDLGATGVDAVYGHGLLNLGGAVAPLGTLVIPVTGSVTGATVVLSGTMLSLGSAFGDALDGSALLGQAFAFDAYDRNYVAGLDSRVIGTARGFGLQALLGGGGIESVEADLPNGVAVSMGVTDPDAADHPARWAGMAADAGPERRLLGMSVAMESKDGADWRIGYDVTPEQQLPGSAASESAGLFWMPGDMLGPQYALVGAGTAFSVSRGAGDNGEVTLGLAEEGKSRDGFAGDARIGELVLAHRFAGGAVATAGFSAIDEQNRFLGSSAAGGFAVEGANSRFYALGGRIPVGAGVEFIGSYTLGEADMTTDGTSLLSDWSTARADAFGLGVVKRAILGDNDRIGFLVGQPLRVNAATATLTAPVDYTIDKTVVQGSERVSLVPTGREVDLQLAYDRTIGPAGSVSGWLMMQVEPGHDADADPAYGAGIRFKAGF